MSFVLFTTLYFLVSFGLGIVLPIYLLRIKSPHFEFWFNILPIVPASAVSSWVARMYWDNYAGWLQFSLQLLVMGVVLIANVALVHSIYRLIYKEKPSFK